MKPLLPKLKRNIIYGVIIGAVGVTLAGQSGLVIGALFHAFVYIVDRNVLC